MVETIKGGLGVADPSKVNLFGANEADQAEYQQSLQDSLTALEMRYAQPNWFNVAAGFFKPQLGGFAASLGSASQAMGENLENQRAAQLPIAQMRSQLAMSKIAMGQNKTVADMEAARLLKGEPLTDDYVSKLVNTAPNSAAAQGAAAQLKTQRERQALTVSQRSSELTEISAQRQMNAGLLRDGLMNAEQYAKAERLLDDRLHSLPAITPESPPRGAKPPLEGTDADAAAAAAAGVVPPPVAKDTAAAAAGAAAPAAPAAPAAAAPAEKVKLTTLPTGARVGPDGLALFQAGIPIISQFRTKEDQEKLKQDGGYQDKKGNWFTKEGRPIAEDSRHFTGDALDLDPKKVDQLTDEQKKLLAEQGFKQGSGIEANHWSRTPTAAPAAAAPTAEKPVAKADVKADAAKSRQAIMDVSITPTHTLQQPVANMSQAAKEQLAQRNTVITAQAAAAEAPAYKDYQDSQTLLNKGLDKSAKSTFNQLDDFYKTHVDDLNEISNLLRKKGGTLGTLLQNGIGINVMGYGARIDLSVLAALKSNMPDNLQPIFDQYIQKLAGAAYYGLLGQGVNLTTLSKEDQKSQLANYIAQNFDTEKTPEAQYASVKQARIDFDHKYALADAWRHTYKKAQAAGSLAPAYDAQQHPLFELENSIYEAKLENERQRVAAINNALTKKKGP